MQTMTHAITRVSSTQAQQALPALVELLQDAVHQGASVGFLAPLAEDKATHYWHGILDAIAAGDKSLWLAYADSTVVGAVQLEPCTKDNGRHRAEVQKLFVLHPQRRAGIAAGLMQALEQYAQRHHIRTLCLDTETGSPAELFYHRRGYTKVGDIPDYCLAANGTPSGTSVYYKHLPAAPVQESP